MAGVAMGGPDDAGVTEPALPQEAVLPRSADFSELGNLLEESARGDVLASLSSAGGLLAEVFERYRTGLTTSAQIVAVGVGDGNSGAVNNLLLRIRVVLGEPWVSTPKQARACAGTVKSLLRQGGLSPASRDHLGHVLATLLAAADDASGQEVELAQQESDSAELERELRAANGVYVYTYPQYWRYPVTPESSRHLLKVGKTTQGAWKRVCDQARATGAPEDPLLLRVYLASEPDDAERVFHRLLEAAEHTRQATRSGGREWFATTLEFLDEIANAIGLQIRSGT
jgi:hypothetical protein